MNRRSSALIKSLTIMLITLVIGALAGSAITGAIVRNRLEAVRSFANSDGFSQQFLEVVEPLTDEQRAQIEPFVESAGDDIQEVIGITRLELFLIIQRLEEDIQPFLTEDQLMQLQDRREEVRRQFGERRAPEVPDE